MRNAVSALIRKDLLLQRRTPEAVPAMVLFSIGTFVLFHFALDEREVSGNLASGILWVTLLFAAVLGMNRLFVAEREEGGFDAFLLAPVDRTSLFVAKAAVLFGFLVALQVVAVPAFAILLLDEPLANLDPGAAAAVEPLIGPGSGVTRVVISHDVAHGLAEADLVLGLRGGRQALLAPRAETGEAAVRELYA